MAGNAVLVLIGVACVCLCVFIIIKLKPREGEPSSVWVSTDLRGNAVAMGLLILLITGVALVIKGVAA